MILRHGGEPRPVTLSGFGSAAEVEKARDVMSSSEILVFSSRWNCDEWGTLWSSTTCFMWQCCLGARRCARAHCDEGKAACL